jgi:hypothetical protein
MHHAYHEPGSEQPTNEWDSVEPSFQAKVVCAGCNNGWMSQLETAVRPRLEPMMGGVPRSLSRVDCQVLSRWSAKTALMFQAAERAEDRMVAPQLYLDFKTTSGLPDEVRVWAGRVQARGAWQRTFGGDLGVADDKRRFFTSLLAVDRASFMVTGCEDPATLRRLELGHLANGWVEIGHRTAGTKWPPPFTFEADQFAGMPTLLEKLARVPAKPD